MGGVAGFRAAHAMAIVCPVAGHTAETKLCCPPQERMESAKRGWELQNLQKLKTEEEDRLFTEGEEELFTYTREDAYNMVGRCTTACKHPK